MLQRIYKFFRRDSQKGQGIVEYALILAFVVGIAAVALTSSGQDSIGTKIKNLFSNTGTAIETAGTNAQNQGGNQQGNE